LFGIEGTRAKIVAVDRALAEERRRLAAAEAGLASLDLRRQNVEAAYLEARVRERTFPWSALFEHLAEVLPRRVRLVSLSPQVGDALAGPATRSRRPASVASSGKVLLQMTGVAGGDEALTDLLNNLFRSRWFATPSLPTERIQDGGIGFVLSVSYLPAGASAPAAAAAAAPAAEPTASSPTVVEAAPGGGEPSRGEI
jgi:Tfp pilus assembly protein PilN